jgi:hypothetical protein
VDQGVVIAAEEGEVVDLGGTILCPGHYVMDVAPCFRTVADGEDALQIAGGDGGAQRRGHEALGSPDVEWLAPRPKDDPGQVGITEETIDLVMGKEGARSGLRDPGPTIEESLGRDVDEDVGAP